MNGQCFVVIFGYGGLTNERSLLLIENVRVAANETTVINNFQHIILCLTVGGGVGISRRVDAS